MQCVSAPWRFHVNRWRSDARCDGQAFRADRSAGSDAHRSACRNGHTRQAGRYQVEGADMSDCIHCEIHDLLETHLQTEDANLAEIASKVTEVLADLILMAPPADRGMLIADVLANLGQFVLDKNEETVDAGQSSSRRLGH
jgi:hypothetical protein